MRKKSNTSVKAIIINLLFITTIIFLIFFIFNFRFVKVDGESMYPKLSDGQVVLINKNCENIQHDDIVVFKTDDGYSIKRVIAINDDIVELKSRSVFLNCAKLSPYTYDGDVSIRYTLGKDEYFVVGDNYSISYDSRDYGPIQRSSIIGKVIIEF